MKRYLPLIAVVVGLLVYAGCKEQQSSAGVSKNRKDSDSRYSESKGSKNIVQTAEAAGNFNTLVQALMKAGLADTLSSKGPYTVFAPTDAAFAKLPPGKLDELMQSSNKKELQNLLKYHVVSGEVTAADVAKMDSAKTLEGDKLTIRVQQGTVMVDDAKVTKTDVKCSNGIIHVINKVLSP